MRSDDSSAGDEVAIVRLGHVEYRVTDLERARHFYVDLIGLHETERDADHVYLRAIEDREHHTLILRRADSPGVGHVAFKVASEEALERLARRFARLGLLVRWWEKGREHGQGRALRVRDPFGFPIEYYAEMREVEWLLQRHDLHRGVAPTRIDHVNVLVPDAHAGHEWYTNELGFKCAELTEGPDGRVWASWNYRKSTVHDVAVMTGPGPAVHHAGIALAEPFNVIRGCDILAGAGLAHSIERGPARHGISNALFVYVRDPDGNRVELYTGDYLTSDPDFKTIRWKLDDRRRQTLWGPPPPRRWFEEYMRVESLDTGELIEVSPPTSRPIPTYVDD